MTPRGVQVLSDADMIAAEDTRHSRGLLSHFGIRTPSFSYHKFNEEKRGDFFIDALLDGKDLALISDAGTPCISDPGHKLVSQAAAAGVEVIAVCGANAVAAAVSVSGFDVSNFVFLGFLPRSAKEQAAVFMAETGTSRPLVFYESPLRIAKTIDWLDKTYPAADICLCNDLTKKFERIYRGTPAEVLIQLSENPSAHKGEYTCVARLNPATKDTAEGTSDEVHNDISLAENISIEARLVDIIIKQGCTLKDAANLLHQQLNDMTQIKSQQSHAQCQARPNKKAIYAATLRLKELFT